MKKILLTLAIAAMTTCAANAQGFVISKANGNKIALSAASVQKISAVNSTVADNLDYYTKNESDERISNLQTQVDNANQLHATKVELSTVNTGLQATIEVGNAELQTAIDVAKTEFKAADQALQKLIDSKVDASEFKSTVEDMYEKLQTCSETSASNLSDAISEFNSKDAQLEAAINSSRQDRVEAENMLMDYIQNQQTTIASQQAIIDTLLKQIEELNARVSALESK